MCSFAWWTLPDHSASRVQALKRLALAGPAAYVGFDALWELVRSWPRLRNGRK